MVERIRSGRGSGPQAPRNSGPALRGSAQAEVLTSRDNRWLKEFRVALRGGVATADGAVGMEGVRLVEEALMSGCRVEALLFSESGERHRERLAPTIAAGEAMGFPVLRTTDRLFEGIADTEHPQGVAALVVPRVWTLEELLAGGMGHQQTASSNQESGVRTGQVHTKGAEEEHRGHGESLKEPNAEAQSTRRAEEKRKDQDPLSRNEGRAPGNRLGIASRREAGAPDAEPGRREPLIVVLAGVQDPGNVGTILRTAAAFGATGVVTAATGQSGTASPFAPKAMRASAGAALHLPIVSGMALGILLTQLKLKGIRTLASCVEDERAPAPRDSAQAVAPWELDWREAIALLVGNEGAGLPEEVVKGADVRVRIPMAARVESLNAGAAAAVVLYEAYRQRRNARVAGDEWQE